MAGKDVIPAEEMVAKIRAAADARRSTDFFLIARTDARAVHGLDEALRRGEQYLEAGADGIFIEAPQTIEELETGRPRLPGRAAARQHARRRRPDAGAAAGRAEADGLRHGGLSDHADLSRRAHASRRALADIKAGRPEQRRQASTSTSFKAITGFDDWAAIEDNYAPPERGSSMRALSSACTSRCCCCLALPASGQDGPAQTKVRLAVGGKPALFYLPLTVTERLGYFKDEGLDVEISDFAGGARALQALIGGSADVVTGSFDHTIQMQAKNQPIIARGAARPLSGLRAGVLGAEGRDLSRPADLKGMKIGVTAPGSSTHFMVRYMMAQAGLKPDDASFVGVGTGQTAIAAARRGEIDALVNVDPVISLLESEKPIRIVADTRTVEGTRAGLWRRLIRPRCSIRTPAYAQNNPRTVQSLANAFVRGLKWIAEPFRRRRSPSVMPAEYALGNTDMLRPLDPQQPADVFAGRPLQPRGRGDRAQGAARVRPRRAQRHDRSGRDLHRRLRRQGPDAIRSSVVRKCSVQVCA